MGFKPLFLLSNNDMIYDALLRDREKIGMLDIPFTLKGVQKRKHL